MQKYKCHKTVEASKIVGFSSEKDGALQVQFSNRIDDFKEVTAEWFAKHEPHVGGYYVVYEDGYTSFSPAAAFESGYVPHVESCDETEPTTCLDFGKALSFLKRGCRVARQGWNGKGMFLFLLPAGDGIPTRVIHDPALRAVIESELGGDTFDALGSIRMFTADKKILTGWLASQTDMLSEDWEILA